MAVTRIADFDFSKISEKTTFVLDTNILYFVHSGYYFGNSNKDNIYSNFIKRINENGNTIIVSSLCLQEFMNLIENQEYRLYVNRINSDVKTFTKKHFRDSGVLKINVKNKMHSALLQLTNTYQLVDSKVEICQIMKFVSDFEKHRFDAIDFLMVKNFSDNVIYLTDDRDFQFDSKIAVVTI